MFFSEIYIDNFKTLRKVRIKLNKELNVFTGTNNAGKTTILEALALWNECFRTLIVKAKKADKQNKIHLGDFRLGKKNNNYIDHRSITSVRTSRYEDIFYEMDKNNQIVISVKLIGQDFELVIPIRIRQANGGNYLIYIDNHDNFDFETFNSNLSLPTPFSAIYASPVAALVSDEKYVTPPQVIQQILSRKSFLVLRNRIAKLQNSQNFSSFENDVSYILFESEHSVSFEVIGNIYSDVKVSVNVDFGNQDTAKDISLLGSGTLQIIELMLAIHEDRSDLNLIMLDEPDSHIHRDIQKRLIDVLVRNSLKAQVFLTTHNESLIRATQPKNIFHISNSGDGLTELEIKPITENNPVSLKVGIQPSGKSKVIKALGNSDSLDILDCLEAKKIVFVEGEDDALYIRNIYEKVSNKTLDDYVFWSLNGLDTFIDCINHYKGFFQVIANGHNLWDKSISIIDADYMTSDQRVKLVTQLNTKIKLPSFIWGEYTIEGSLLSNPTVIKELVYRVFMEKAIDIEKSVIFDGITQVINKHCELMLELLNSDCNFQKKITGQMLNRNQKWEESVGIKNLFSGGGHNYLIDYQCYARPLLQQNNMCHIMTKDDLEILVGDIFKHFNVEIDYSPLPAFEFLLKYYDNSLDVPSWKKMVQFIESV
ncbi:ATP-dependent nuclease [Pseudoalteromonas sp. US3C1013]|uniref:ATP-dependent nuclease n=1 Tax=unclassified Pseudoalteromonas TaxID=194690 RepID=UPI003AB80AC7